MANNKITKRDMFTMIMAEVKDNAEMVDFLKHEIALLDKKSASAKAKASSVDTDLANAIMGALAEIGSGTVTDMQKESDVLGALSNQKVSAIVRKMVENGTLAKTVDKKKSIFSIAE